MASHWKKDFPLFRKRNIAYLDSAATTQKPQCVIEAISKYYAEECGTVHRAVYPLALEATEKYSAVRSQVCQMIGAHEESEIIFTKGTTEGINLIASALGRSLQSGDEIVITTMEHHANIVPWQELCNAIGTVLKVIPVSDMGVMDLDAYCLLLSKKTKLVSLTHVSNVTGVINPIKTVIHYAHEVGAKVVIDGAQAAPHLTIDVSKMDADFYLFSAHKMYGPTGVGVLYGKKEFLESLPAYQSGGDMIESVTFEKTTFQPPPLKFEAGTPNIAGIIGLGAAIDYLETCDKQKIIAHERSLHTYAAEKLQTLPGIQFFGPMQDTAPIISFTIDGTHPLDIGTLLGVKGVAIRTGHLCAQPLLRRFGHSSFCRLSFALYNTFEDVDQLMKGLIETLALL